MPRSGTACSRCWRQLRTALTLGLQNVREGKAGKNRLHLDLIIGDLDLAAAEVPPQQAVALTDPDSPAYLPGFFQIALGSVLDWVKVQLTEAQTRTQVLAGQILHHRFTVIALAAANGRAPQGQLRAVLAQDPQYALVSTVPSSGPGHRVFLVWKLTKGGK